MNAIRALASTAVMLIAAALSGCSGSDNAGTKNESAAESRPSATLPTITPQPSSSQSDLDPPLVTSPDDEILVAPTSGTRAAVIDDFEITRAKFTVRIACEGGGSLEVTVGKTDPLTKKAPCDSVTRRIHVATEQRKETVFITPLKSQRWSAAIVVTDDFSEAGESSGARPA